MLPQEKDRIEKITVNEEAATLDSTSTGEKLVYRVQTVTNDDIANIKIWTKDKTDRITIDDTNSVVEPTWSYNGELVKEGVPLIGKTTEIPITVGIRNNSGDFPLEEEYTLIIEKITDDIEIKEITVNSKDDNGNETPIKATAVSLNRYEVVVSEFTDISLSKVLLNSQYSSVSIDGLDYKLETAEKLINVGTDLSKEIRIAVKSEYGRIEEYTLVIYKANVVLDLVSLRVNEEEAKKVSEGNYVITVPKDTKIANIKALLNNSLGEISIAGNTYKVTQNEENINLDLNTTIVSIKAKTSDGYTKDYTLTIAKELVTEINPKLDMILVNGTLITPETDGKTYIAYLPEGELEAEIRAIAKEITVGVTIEGNPEGIGESTAKVLITSKENTYTVTLRNEEETADYKVIIRKAESDVNIAEVVLKDGDTEYVAQKGDDGKYRVKVHGDLKVGEVRVTTAYAKSKVQINNTGNYAVHEDLQSIDITGEKTNVPIKVQSEDGINEKEYELIIERLSNNTNLLKLEVDGEEATLEDDGNYHYILKTAKTSVVVGAETEDKAPNKAYVNVDNSQFAMYEIAKQVDIISKQTEVVIKVKSEDGSLKSYKLIIEALPDDATIKEVRVNDKLAKYIEGKNRYEIRSKEIEFNVDVILNDILASMELGSNPKAVGKDNITVAKTEEETIVKVKVTSQNGLETEEYTIAILEQSSNSNLDTITVNGKNVYSELDGIYRAKVTHDTSALSIKAVAEDTFAVTKIDEIYNDTYIAEKLEAVVDGKKVYTYEIKVIAENSLSSVYTLEVEVQEANYNIIELKVGETKENLENAILRDDGKYYYKIGRVEEGFVNIVLESEKSKSKINGEIGNLVKVRLEKDITEVSAIVIGEDGTEKTYTLVIEKKSNDTSILSVTGSNVLNTEMQDNTILVYVDEDINKEDLTITLNNKLGSLKLVEETDYTLEKITRTVDLTSSDDSGVVTLNVNARAEDGSSKEYIIYVIKKPNLDLMSVVVNTENVNWNEEDQRYEHIVPNKNKPNLVITSAKNTQTIQLINKDGTVIASGTGVINTALTLSISLLEDNYTIKVISHNGEEIGFKEYPLVIRQKSVENGIIYIKVDDRRNSTRQHRINLFRNSSWKRQIPSRN